MKCELTHVLFLDSLNVKDSSKETETISISLEYHLIITVIPFVDNFPLTLYDCWITME